MNRLGDTVDSARTRQKEVMSLVDQTTNTFQEKILCISDSIDDSLQKGKYRLQSNILTHFFNLYFTKLIMNSNFILIVISLKLS